MKTTLVTMVLLGLTAGLWHAGANEPRSKDSSTQNATKDQKFGGTKHTYLGVTVERVPTVLYSQMPKILTKDQGLLIEHVAKNSPAEKAGLKPNDILVSYNEQKLTSPQQLVKLVHSDSSGKAVTLGYIREGKSETCKATLAEHTYPLEQDNSRIFRLYPDERFQQMYEEFDSTKRDPAAWEMFESMKLTRLDGKRWRAEVDYRTTKDQKTQHKTFEGTREEIRKAVEAEKDLPTAERNMLLRVLNAQRPIFQFHFPPMGPMIPNSSNQF